MHQLPTVVKWLHSKERFFNPTRNQVETPRSDASSISKEFENTSEKLFKMKKLIAPTKYFYNAKTILLFVVGLWYYFDTVIYHSGT